MPSRIVLLFILVMSCVFPSAFPSGLETFPVDSPEWQAAYALSTEAGVLPPSSVAPVTANELMASLGRISSDMLSADGRALLARLMARLERDDALVSSSSVKIGFSPVVSPEFFVHSNAGLSRDEDSLFSLKDTRPLLDLGLDLAFFDVVRLFASYGIGPAPILSHRMVEMNPSADGFTCFDRNYSDNLVTFILDSSRGFEETVMRKGGLVVGGSWFDVSLMRSGTSLGYGRTGNLLVSDNLMSQDFLRLHLYSKWVDYTYLLYQFDALEQTDGDAVPVPHKGDLNGKSRVMPLQSLCFRFFDKVSLSLSAGAMMYVDNPLDLRLLNPIMFVHGIGNTSNSTQWDPDGRDQANNVFSVELSAAVARHLNLNLQVLVDQVQFSFEKDGRDELPANALAVLANVQTSWVRGGIFLTTWAEGAYLMPSVYLNRKMDIMTGRYDHNLGLIAGSRTRQYIDLDYIGYTYGGDCAVFSLGCTLGDLSSFSFSSSVSYIIHGPYGLGYDNLLATRNPDDVSAPAPFGGIGNAEHRLELECRGSWFPMSGLSLDGGIGLVQCWNHCLEKGRTFGDIQLLFSVSIDPVALVVG